MNRRRYQAVYRWFTARPRALAALRTADRALVEKGIPVTDRQSLLYLLEDLGS